MPDEGYSTNFFSQQNLASTNSARVIVPLITDLLHPQRVLDLGCGIGAWMKVFKEQGCAYVKGYDGDYVDRNLLVVEPSEFGVADLTKPLQDRDAPYDLAVSLEVGEHLEAQYADVLVENLTSRAPAVLFSAAIPGQGGTLHVNEQWPSYWAEKFARHGYVALDVIRPHIWDSDHVETYYIQNILLYVRPEVIAAHPILAAEQKKAPFAMDLVHPKQFAAVRDRPEDFENVPIAWAVNRFGRSIKGFLLRRLGRDTRKS